MKMFGRVEMQIHACFDLGGELSRFTPRPLYPRGKTPGWVGLRDDMDALEKNRESKPVVEPAAWKNQKGPMLKKLEHCFQV
jgi:hypothetical protein